MITAVRHATDELIDGVTVYLCTLNDANNIDVCLTSLSHSKYDQLIVVDGSSSDDTASRAKKYTDEVYVTTPGFDNQLRKVYETAKYKYLVGMEADVSVPEGFISLFMSDFLESKMDGLQASIKCLSHDSFWERGLSEFYKIHHHLKGEKDTVGGPNIFETKFRENLLKQTGAQGYSIDTETAEIMKRSGYRVGLSKVVAYQHKSLYFKQFLMKYFNYGKGDYDFYTNNNENWNYRRKLKSIFHVFNRYIIDYPLKSFKFGRPYIAIPYLWMSAFVRYSGWMYTIFKNRNIFKLKN